MHRPNLKKSLFSCNAQPGSTHLFLLAATLLLIVNGGIMNGEARRMVLLITFSTLSCVLTSLSHAMAAKTGTVTGTVTDPAGAVIRGAKVTLRANPGLGQTILTDDSGQFKFERIPFSEFVLLVEAPGFSPTEFAGELHTSVLVHDVHFKSVSRVQHVEVKGQQDSAGNSPSITHYNLEADDVEKMPIVPANRALSAVIESVPGTVPEENGRIHVRGSEVQPQYVLDGIPFSDNLSGTVATALDVENLRSTQVITGNIPAEFGDKTAAVVNLRSKSGLDGPWRGSLAFSAGSFHSRGADGELGGQFKKLGLFLTGDASGSYRFLDPPEIGNFRNRGCLAHIFARFDLLATSVDVVRMMVSTNGTNFQVPNLLEQQLDGQRRSEELRDDFAALNWNHAFNPMTVSDLTVFRRSSTARLLDPEQTGSPFFLQQVRRQRTEGLRATLNIEKRFHALKIGIESYRLPLTETFSIATTDPADIDPNEPILAFTPSRPFLFSSTRTGNREAAYLQYHIRLKENLTVDAGLRFDHYGLLIHEKALSPRIGAAYHFAQSGTTIRASYNRFFQTPPLENLLLSSSRLAATLSSLNRDSVSPVPAERQNAYEFGVAQEIGKYLRLNLVRYVKNIRNFSDDQQLFTTAIVFPVALHGADIRGTEIRLDLMPVRGWLAYASYANARATATGPLVGGLFLGGEEDALLGRGSRFAADQDERNELQFGTTYNHDSGAWFSFTGRYDSGIPTEFDRDDFADFDPRIQRQLDPDRMRIRPRALFRTAAGIELRRESKMPVALQISVNNPADRFYLYNFHSVFSGTHVGRPRELIGRIVFRWTKITR